MCDELLCKAKKIAIIEHPRTNSRHITFSTLCLEVIVAVWNLHVTDAARWKLESPDSWALAHVVWVDSQQVLVRVALYAPGLPAAVRHEMT